TKNRKHGDGQIAHELARNARPEHHGQKHHYGGGGGAEDGPEHPVDGFGVGIPRGVSLGHLGVGKLHHHDGTVDQDPQPQQEPEDHHEVVGEAQHGDDDEGEQEGEGYRQGHQHTRAYADGSDDHNQYQD